MTTVQLLKLCESNLCISAALLLFMAAAAEQTTLQLLPLSFPPSSHSANGRRRDGHDGGAQQALPGTLVVLLYRAVLVALVAGTVHFIITGEFLGEENQSLFMWQI